MDHGGRSLLALGPLADRSGREACRRGRMRMLEGDSGRPRDAQALAVGGDAGLHSPAQALPQVEPVGDLESGGGAEPGPFGVAPVQARQMISTPEWRKVSQAAGGGVDLRAEQRGRQRHDPAEQGHPPRANAELTHLAGVGPPGEREPDPFQEVIEGRGEARVRAGQLGERLGEGTTRAVARIADEAPDLSRVMALSARQAEDLSACAGRSRAPGLIRGRGRGMSPRTPGLAPSPRPCRAHTNSAPTLEVCEFCEAPTTLE